MSTQLNRIATKAREDTEVQFTSLAHIITPEFLKETWRMMNRKGAGGVDGETTQEFESQLEQRLNDIWQRLKQKQYRAPPVRRVNIDKGGGKTRPLGIPTVEDRLVQRAVARILEAIFEPNFLDFSYGFRPNRNPHQAIKAVKDAIVYRGTNYVYEADIRGYFNHINHEWLMKMLRQRIVDPSILHLIGKWLKAGVMEHGVVTRNEEGTPQGGPISPILANIYLHYVLDLWFAKRCQKYFRGRAYLVRFADDFVVCFADEADAEMFQAQIAKRLAKFGLELAEEKTRLFSFGRKAREQAAKDGKKPETFEFLGFKHVCGTERKGRFTLVRIPTTKSCRKFLGRVRRWLKSNIHADKRGQQKQLTQMLRGFYQYFAINHCREKLSLIRLEVLRQWVRALRRKSQRQKTFWSRLKRCAWFKLPYATNFDTSI